MKGAQGRMLEGGRVQRICEPAGKGLSERAIARKLGISRNAVAGCLGAEGVPEPKPRPSRGSKPDPYEPYADRRLSDGL